MSRRTERSGPAQMASSEHAGRRQRERHTEAAACSGRAPGAAPGTPPSPPLGPTQRTPTQLTELRRDALRRNERDSAQRAAARLPSRAAVRWAELHPPTPTHPPLSHRPPT